MHHQLLFTVLSLLLLSSCRPGQLSPPEYQKWLSESQDELGSSISQDGYRYSVRYVPKEYLALQDLLPGEPTAEALEEQVAAREGYLYFVFRIEPEASRRKDFQQFINEQQQYLAFGAQQDFSFIRPGESIKCALYHFERSMNLTPFHQFLLAFPGDEKLLQGGSIRYAGQQFSSHEINLSLSHISPENIPTLSL
ncbi:MAG: hypothetical protein AAF206_23850 [Bacteroidota bacterium]